jgi:hypothetical protein
MRSRLVIGALAAMATLTLAGPTFAATPTREVFDYGTPEIEALIAADLLDRCGLEVTVDAVVTVTVTTWTKRDGTLLLETDMWNGKWTYTNVATGATTVLRVFGPDHFWLNKHGDLMHSITGIGGYYPGLGYFNGYVLINETTGEILRKMGKFFGDIEQVVCAPLAA